MHGTTVPLIGMITLSIACLLGTWLMTLDVAPKYEKAKIVVVFGIFGQAFAVCGWLLTIAPTTPHGHL